MTQWFKLLRQRKDGTLGPLFINAKLRVPMETWLEAEDHPTPGYARRPGWHVTPAPIAPHLTETGRVWCEVQVGNVTPFKRPRSQGSMWYVADRMKVVRVLGKREVMLRQRGWVPNDDPDRSPGHWVQFKDERFVTDTWCETLPLIEEMLAYDRYQYEQRQHPCFYPDTDAINRHVKWLAMRARVYRRKQT